MKNIAISIGLLLFICNPIFAQDSDDNEEQVIIENRNEFSLNVGSLLGGFPEFEYEYILNEESSLGLAVGFAIDDELEYKFAAIPFYRFYFGKKPAAGFFIEGNAALFSEEIDNVFIEGSSTGETEMGFGFGLAVGGKFLSKSNWTGELFAGVGRTLINDESVSGAYPRVGISVGKRF